MVCDGCSRTIDTKDDYCQDCRDRIARFLRVSRGVEEGTPPDVLDEPYFDPELHT